MNNPKKEAKRLVDKYYMFSITWDDAKQCAFIHIEEQCLNLARLQEELNHSEIVAIRLISKEVKRLQQVKKEIEALV